MAKVSVIVPMYNVEKYLRRCLDSLIGQTLKAIEIILIDDGSPDSCPEICEEYAAKDSRIIVVHKKNAGLGFARNSGLEVATGDYVAFVDSDDYVDLTMYEKLYKTAKKLSLDTVYCGFNEVDAKLKTRSISEVSELEHFDSPKKIQSVLFDMIATEPSSKIERKYAMSVWHAIYSRELIIKNKIRFYSEREFLSEDIIFHIDYLSKSSKIAFIPEPFYYYCFNDNSLTKTFREDSFKRQKNLYNAILLRLNILEYDKKLYKDRMAKFFIGYVKFNLARICKANISYQRKKELIMEICSDPIWLSIAAYPVKETPIKQRIIIHLIKTKSVNLLIMLYKLFRN